MKSLIDRFSKKQSEAIESGLLLSGEKVITEFSKTRGGFQDHSSLGFVPQTILPLRNSYSFNLMGTNLDCSYAVYIYKELRALLNSKTSGSAYGYYQQFIHKDVFDEKKSARMASVGIAKRAESMSKSKSNFILCHATQNTSRPGVNVELWTITNHQVSVIHSYKSLPVSRDMFITDLNDSIEIHRGQYELSDHDVYIYGDSVLGFSEKTKWPLKLTDTMYQLPESELYSSAVELPLIEKQNGKNKKDQSLLIASLLILGLSPAFVFGINNLYKNRFNEEKQAYILLTQEVDGLDEKGRNTSQVAIWEARDTHLRQQRAKTLDTDNLELLVRAISSSAMATQSKISVKTIDYSRSLKSRNGLPPYHFRLELLILKSPALSEGEAIDSVYRSLGSALSQVTDEFVTPGNPRQFTANKQQFYRVEFVGRFTEAQMKTAGGNNA